MGDVETLPWWLLAVAAGLFLVSEVLLPRVRLALLAALKEKDNG
jgi:hypothetical protein